MATYFQLETLFSDHIMFQADQPIRLFGTCQKNIHLDIILLSQHFSFDLLEGHFVIELPIISYTEDAFNLMIRCFEQEVILNDCVFGDVYVASGQSNMQFTVKEATHVQPETLPQVRFYEVPKLPYENAHIEFPYFYSSNPGWHLCTIEEVNTLSAIGYLVSKELNQKTQRPIGIISCNMGDTSVFSWTDIASLKAEPGLKNYLDFYQTEIDRYRSKEEYVERFNKQLPRLMEFYGQIDKGVRSGLPSDKAHEEAYRYYPDPYIPMGPKHYNRPAGCFDMMVSKVRPYQIKGVLFYQGESDHQNCELYQLAFKTMVESWRNAFMNNQLPFVYVQIANYSYPGTVQDAIAKVRDAQTKSIDLKHHLYMVSALDQGESENIHPKNKTIVAKRIADVLLEFVYHQAQDSLSPCYNTHKMVKNKCIISSKYNTLPLKSISGKNLGFKATVDGINYSDVPSVSIKGSTIELDLLPNTVEIRYCFENNPQCDIYSCNDLPYLPFQIKL